MVQAANVIFESISEAILLINPDDFIILAVNPAALKQLNLSEAEVVGRRCYEVTHRRSSPCESPDNPCPMREVLTTGRSVTVKHTHYGKDGNPFYVECSVYPVKDNQQRTVQVVHVSRDIPEHKKAEDALEESEKKYRFLFMNMLNGFANCKIVLGEKGEPIDFVYLDVNDAFERLTGLKKTDVLGRKATEAIPGIREANPELFDIYGRVALTGKEENFETYFKPLHIWLSISVYCPEKGYFVTIFENITQRKKAEELLVESERKYRVLVDNALVGIYRTNIKGDILYANDALAVMLEFESTEKLMSSNIIERYLHPKDRQVLVESLKKKGKVDALETKLLTKTGKNRDVILSALLEKETVLGVVLGSNVLGGDILSGMILDITQRKLAEQRIVELNSLLVVITEINQCLLRIKSESELFRFVCDSLAKIRWIRLAWVGLVEKESFKVKPIAHAGVEDGFFSTVKVTWDDREYDKGPIGGAIKTRHPLVIKDIATDPRFSPYKEEALKRGYKSSVSLPLAHKEEAEEEEEEVVGVLNIFSDRENAFDDEKVGFLVQVANDVAMGIRTLRRQEERLKFQGKLIDLAYRLNGLSPGGCFLCESHSRVFKAYADLTFHGVPGLCIIREDPEKLVKEYGIKPEDVRLLSSKPMQGFQTLQDLQEVSIAISKFHETDKSSVILLDGLEYLVSRFGFDVVYKFVQEKRFDFLEKGALLLIPFHMATLTEKERALLTSEIKSIEGEID